METQTKQNKKIVLAGGPGSGKTTLIELFIQNGYSCFEEVARDLIQKGKEMGKENFFAEDPLTFSRLVWEGRKKQYRLATAIDNSNKKGNFIFFDRGLADVTAYLRHTKLPQIDWEEDLKNYPYDIVFLLSPEASIYRKDESRMESYQEAMSLHQAVKKNYLELGPVVEVPFLPPQERFDFILHHCNERST